MSEIQRFRLDHSSSNVSLISSANGSFVAWYDHERIVSELKAEIERLQICVDEHLRGQQQLEVVIDEYKAERDQLRLRVEEQGKEIESLHANRRNRNAVISDWQKFCGQLAEILDALSIDEAVIAKAKELKTRAERAERGLAAAKKGLLEIQEVLDAGEGWSDDRIWGAMYERSKQAFREIDAAAINPPGVPNDSE